MPREVKKTSETRPRDVYPVRLYQSEKKALERIARQLGEKNGAAMIRKWIRTFAGEQKGER